MKILSIETSCDETAIAILDISGPLKKPDIKILGNALLSQIHIHEQYGGVFPTLAKREHEKNLPILLEQTLNEAEEDLKHPTIDYIAVTTGPGLEPALWTGITFAQKLSEETGKPIIPVNHMRGHIWSVLYNNMKGVELPAIALLVSGGHTELVEIKDFSSYKIIGRTLDDAVGEAFDKVARMLGLSYPGGPKIDKLATASRKKKAEIDIKFPRPMLHSKNLNFSYSGLKTAVLYKIKSEERDDEEFKEDIARAFSDAAIEVLVEKTRKALEERRGEVKTLIVGGGVASNTQLSQSLEKMILDFPEVNLHISDKPLATDNAVMIGIAGFVEATTNPEILSDSTLIKARGSLSISSLQ